MKQKSMFPIDQGCITSRENGVLVIIQSFTVECCVHYIILKKIQVINYPFEIPSDTQPELLSETYLLGDDLPRSRLSGRDDAHLIPIGGVAIKYPLCISASNN